MACLHLFVALDACATRIFMGKALSALSLGHVEFCGKGDAPKTRLVHEEDCLPLLMAEPWKQELMTTELCNDPAC